MKAWRVDRLLPTHRARQHHPEWFNHVLELIEAQRLVQLWTGVVVSTLAFRSTPQLPHRIATATLKNPLNDQIVPAQSTQQPPRISCFGLSAVWKSLRAFSCPRLTSIARVIELGNGVSRLVHCRLLSFYLWLRGRYSTTQAWLSPGEARISVSWVCIDPISNATSRWYTLHLFSFSSLTVLAIASFSLS